MDVCIFLKSLKPDTVDWGARPPFVSCFTNPRSPSPQRPISRLSLNGPANHFLKLRGHWINDVFVWQPRVACWRRVFREGAFWKLQYWWSVRNYRHLGAISWAQESEEGGVGMWGGGTTPYEEMAANTQICKHTRTHTHAESHSGVNVSSTSKDSSNSHHVYGIVRSRTDAYS